MHFVNPPSFWRTWGARCLQVATLVALTLCGTAHAQSPDFSSTAGTTQACAAQPQTAQALKNNTQRQSFVICKDLALVENVVQFVMRHFHDRPDDAEIGPLLRKQLRYMRDELRTVRSVLERTRLAPNEGLLLAPDQWKRDLDGDGEISTWESHFFAIPKRSTAPLRFHLPRNDEDDYTHDYQLDATVRVDQSDVLWLLAYHNFAEALVEILLSYELKDTGFDSKSIELVDRTGMQRASQRLTQGLKTSEAMRVSVLAETDDDHEWIGNPQQKNFAFPVRLDSQDFAVWGELMQHAIPLFAGQTLFLPDPKASGPLGAVAKLCPPGMGLHVPSFFNNPPRYPLLTYATLDLSSMCKRPSSPKQISGLFDFLETYNNKASGQDGGAMRYLRRLLWVN